MACALTQGYTLDCRDSVGGIKTIYVTELANKSSITAASGTITAFTLTAGKKFWTYELMKETAALTENITTSDTNGTLFFEQDLTFTIRKMQASLSQEIKLLAQNRLMIIVLDRNGKYWLLGENNGAELQPSTSVTGTAFGDMNGYNLVFKAKEESPMNEVASNLITSLTT
jgi:outer membrane protein assembly factor BamB